MSEESNMTWVIDTTIFLEEICETANWHLATVICALVAKGLTREDAEAFAEFAFDDKATGGTTDNLVNDEQWDRLELIDKSTASNFAESSKLAESIGATLTRIRINGMTKYRVFYPNCSSVDYLNLEVVNCALRAKV